MAKQKTPSSVKKTQAGKEKVKPAQAKKPATKTKSATPKTKTAKTTASQESDNVHWITGQITNMLNDFIDKQNIDSALTGTERRRLIGAAHCG